MKSEALRDRHWVLVMERTGVSFDASSTSFTLRNLVEMELFRYEDEINEIVAGAQREQNIEKGIKEIEDKWRFQRLEMFPFKDDRGYVLGSIDDILMVLEENMLNLGAYSSNPSAAVFVDQVCSTFLTSNVGWGRMFKFCFIFVPWHSQYAFERKISPFFCSSLSFLSLLRFSFLLSDVVCL